MVERHDSHEFDPRLRALNVSGFASVLSIGICSLIFFEISTQFSAWRNGFTEGTFQPLYEHYVYIGICWIAGAFAVEQGNWRRPYGFALFAYIVYFLFISWPGLAWEGPGDLKQEIAPLICCRYELLVVALLFHCFIVSMWIRFTSTSNSRKTFRVPE